MNNAHFFREPDYRQGLVFLVNFYLCLSAEKKGDTAQSMQECPVR
ncbi:hypothetical protein EI42_04651 [Thermosporothrix hazakensis]|jgi:hypothetical protein|uniref:Uncharacterized protein n=1 Tax=Thermosporothrix hazakensis TaxID=644383 RepID=A0A326UDT6_THEHA|nr:hypothetical protein EI42_04651 [Thermosporothrix hazakensis]